MLKSKSQRTLSENFSYDSFDDLHSSEHVYSQKKCLDFAVNRSTPQTGTRRLRDHDVNDHDVNDLNVSDYD